MVLKEKKQFKDCVDVQGLKKVKIYISNLLGFKSFRNEYRRGSWKQNLVYKLLYQIVNSVTNLGNNNFYYATYIVVRI